MYLLVIAAATQQIDLASAYFVPDELTSEALVAAMRRGVRFRLIVPGPIVDTDVVRRASRATWGPLLEAGAEIYEYQPTMFHCKVMIVDGLLTSVGSTNFDPTLVPPERRGQPQRLRRARSRPGRWRCSSSDLARSQTRYARGLAEAAVAREARWSTRPSLLSAQL